MRIRVKILSILLVLVLFFTILSLSLVVAAAEYTLKLGTLENEQYPFTIGARYFEKRLEEETDGKIDVEVYPNAILGDEFELWENIQNGVVDMCVTASAGQFIPEWQIIQLPYLFKSYDHWDAMMQGPLMIKLEDLMVEKAGIMVLSYFGGSGRHLISTDKKIDSLDDVKGIKMRVWPNPTVVKTWELLRTNPIVVAYAETYTALQTGVVKAAENIAATFITQKWCEPGNYITLTNHDIIVRPLIIGVKQFNQFSPELQKIIRSVAREAAEYEVKVERKLEQEYFNEMEEDGLEIVELTDIDKWIEATKKMREEFAEKYNLVDFLQTLENSKDSF